MLTFSEFLIEYNEQVNEAYESLEVSRNARKAINFVMNKYLGNQKYDPLEILNLFQNACYAAMKKGSVDRVAIRNSVDAGMEDFTTSEEYFTGMGRAR